MRKGELEADKDRMMREYRAQLDAERAIKLAKGRNHSSSKSSRKKGIYNKIMKEKVADSFPLSFSCFFSPLNLYLVSLLMINVLLQIRTRIRKNAVVKRERCLSNPWAIYICLPWDLVTSRETLEKAH